MGEIERPIRNVSDTARLAAYHRARETERPDALFRDPLAAKLAGERGVAIAEDLPRKARHDWAWVTRTVLFDRFLTQAIADGMDTVVVLAAGLDARPYRLKLPPALRWFEVDLPALLQEKEALLAGERPACRVERRACDLLDAAARRVLLQEIGAGARRAVVVAEGLLIYLAPEQVAALGRELAAVPAVERWIVDLTSPGLARMLQKKFDDRLTVAGAPFLFSPEEGPDFFVPLGWRPTEVASMLKEGARLKRLTFPLSLLAKLPERPPPPGKRPWSAVLRLDRAPGAR